MDVLVSIPAAAAAASPMESMSDDKIAIVIPHKSPSNKQILPLGFQEFNDPSPTPPGGFANRVALPLIKKVITHTNP
jgi:aquaporin NIP